MKLRTVFRDAIIVLSVSAVLLSGSELALRLIFPERIIRVPKPEVSAYQFHADYLISLKPNIVKTYVRSQRNGGDTIQWQTNNAGFRGSPLRPNPDLRVFVYGDSNILGRFSRVQNTFAGRLAHYLTTDPETDIEVVNAGVVGFGPDQVLIRLEEESLTYEPDIVVFHIFADNDFGDIVRNRLVELDDRGGIQRTRHARTVDEVISGIGRRHLRQVAASMLTVRAARRLVRVVGLAVGIRSVSPPGVELSKMESIRRVTKQENQVYENGAGRRFSHFADHYDLDLATDPDAASSVTKRSLMAAVLASADSLAKARGVELLVVIQPSAIDVAPENVTFDLSPLRQARAYRPSNLSDVVQQICVVHEIRCVDLFDSFMMNSPRDLYFVGEPHWNDRGQDLAAAETAAFILDKVLR